MSCPVPPYRTFLRRVHRRLVGVRMAEAAGVGLVAGSAFSIVLTALLLWIGRPAAGAVGVLMTAGAVAGAAMGWARRAGMMASAVKADSQLMLSDLLSTALAVEREADGKTWAAAVIESANLSCAEIAPSAVVLRRLSGRVWGWIVLCSMLAVTLAALTGGSANGLAGESDSVPTGGTFSANLPPLPGSAAAASHVASPKPRRRTWTDPDEQTRSIGGVTTPADARPADGATRRADAPQRPGLVDDTGPGAASSGVAAKSQPPTARPTAPPGVSAPSSPNAASTAVGGTDPGSKHAGETGGQSSLSGGSDASFSHPAPPWDSSSWSADVAAAQRAVDAGRVPAGYRDIVQDYFNRPALSLPNGP